MPPRKSAVAVNKILTEEKAAKVVEGLYALGKANGPYWTDSMVTAISDAYSNIVKNDAAAEAEVWARWTRSSPNWPRCWLNRTGGTPMRTLVTNQ